MQLYRAATHTSAELAELFSVARSTVYRVGERASGTTSTTQSAPSRSPH